MHPHSCNSWAVTSSAKQQKVKGRGATRRQIDILAKVNRCAARDQAAEDTFQAQMGRIDPSKLSVNTAKTLSSTSRKLQKELEEAGEMHVCQRPDCPVVHRLHVREYAAIDAEALVDLHQYAGLTCWAVTRRGILIVLKILTLGWSCSRCCCRGCCAKKTNRHTKDMQREGTTSGIKVGGGPRE